MINNLEQIVCSSSGFYDGYMFAIFALYLSLCKKANITEKARAPTFLLLFSSPSNLRGSPYS